MALPRGGSEGGEEEKGFEKDVTVRCCPLKESAAAINYAVAIAESVVL